MMRCLVRFAVLVVVAISLGPSAAPSVAQEATPECPGSVWLEPLAATPEPAGAAEATEAAPAWMTAELTDACSGQSFALADFAGKVLFIEPMATWCTTCRGQLTRLQEAAARIPANDRASIVLVVLSSEVGLPNDDLAAYAARNDFPFLFAVMPEAMVRDMAGALGQEIAVPPATPHLIVAPNGTVGELRTGGASADELLALFTEAAQPASS